MSNKQNENNKNAEHQFSNTEPLTHSQRVAIANEMSKKQSSIEWLIEQLIEHRYIIVNKTTYGDKVKAKHEILLEQAKAMHKEEVLDANFFGQRLHAKSITNTMMEENSEQYYNETFNNEQPRRKIRPVLPCHEKGNG